MDVRPKKREPFVALIIRKCPIPILIDLPIVSFIFYCLVAWLYFRYTTVRTNTFDLLRYFFSFEGDAAVLNQENQSSTPGELFSQVRDTHYIKESTVASAARMDPPDDEPPSLKIESMEYNESLSPRYIDDVENHVSSPPRKPGIDDQGFFTMEPTLDVPAQDGIIGPDDFSDHHASPVSESSRHNQEQFKGFEPARDDEYPEESRSPESNHNQYFQDNPTSPSNQYFQESFESPENDEHDEYEHFKEATGVSVDQSEGSIQEPDEPIQIEDSSQESHEIDEYMVNISNEFTDDYESHNVESTHRVLSNPIGDEEFHHSDEKKFGIEKDEVDSDLNDSEEFSKEELEMSDEQSTNDQPRNDIVEPIDTSYTRPSEYDDNPSPYPFSPAGMSTNSGMDSRGHQSPAMRGAHEMLKRNRRRRHEV